MACENLEYNDKVNSGKYTRHLGDDFGCRIETNNQFFKENCHRYYLKDIRKNGVADQMKLKAGDQLVLLNRQFISEWTYSQVIEQVGGIPVDSKTRFSLVLFRRTYDQQFEWVVSNAILCVDNETGNPDGKVFVKSLQYKTVGGPRYDDINVFRLKVKGTDLYLKIFHGEVLLEVAKSADKNRYNIYVWTKCNVDHATGSISYTACLYGDNVNLGDSDDKEISDGILDGIVSVQYGYVTVAGDSSVTVRDSPQWFGYREEGRGQSYEIRDLLSWISCEIKDFGTSGKLCIKPNEFFFESYWVGRQDVDVD